MIRPLLPWFRTYPWCGGDDEEEFGYAEGRSVLFIWLGFSVEIVIARVVTS